MRILLTPLFMALLLQGNYRKAFMVFILAVVTDVADGLTARLWQQKSPLGTFMALADVFAAEIHELIEAGCRHVQLEDLGAWMPYLSGDQDWAWVNEIVDRTMRGIDRAQVRTSWHFCMGNAWGNKLEGMTAGGYRAVLPHYLGVAVDEYVLDFACREMEDADLLRQLPADKRIPAGVIDVRTLEIEHPEQVAERIRKVLRHIEPERVTLTTDCGLKQLPRPCAREKLRALLGEGYLGKKVVEFLFI